MRRLVDLILIGTIAGIVLFGAYVLGRHVDRLSSQAASADSELAQPSKTEPASGRSDRRLTPVIVGAAVGALIVTFAAASGVNAVVRSRRRQRWRAG